TDGSIGDRAAWQHGHAAITIDREDRVDAVCFENERLRRLRVPSPLSVSAGDRDRGAGSSRSELIGEIKPCGAREWQGQRGRWKERSGCEDGTALLEEQAQVGQRSVTEHHPFAKVLPERVGCRRIVDVRA